MPLYTAGGSGGGGGGPGPRRRGGGGSWQRQRARTSASSVSFGARDQYALNQLRTQLARDLKIDADRDVQGGAIKPYRYDTLPAEFIPKDPWYKSVWMGRVLALLLLVSGSAWLGTLLYGHFR